MIDLGNGRSVDGYDKINIILGKNGSGKSSLLRQLDSLLLAAGGCVRYITPERGGVLSYDGNVDTNRATNSDWLIKQRRKNQYDQFRQSSVAEFRNLETLVLRTIESDPDVRASDFVFDTEIDHINSVLDQVEVTRSGTAGFDVRRKESGQVANVTQLSSGESELVSLAIEILYFAYHANKNSTEKLTTGFLLMSQTFIFTPISSIV